SVRRRRFILHAQGVDAAHGIAAHVLVQVEAVGHSQGIAAHPPRQPRRTVSCPVIIQSALLIALPAGEPVALAGEAAKAGLAVGRVFLAVDPVARATDGDAAAAQMIPQVELYPRRGVVRERSTDADQHDPTLVVHDVQSVILLNRAEVYDPMMLEEAID